MLNEPAQPHQRRSIIDEESVKYLELLILDYRIYIASEEGGFE